MFRTLSKLLALTLMFGCSSTPSPEEVATANYGPYPENYEQIKSYMESVLKDPYSVIYRSIEKPEKSWYKQSNFEQPIYGYQTCVTYNAKNSFGAYTGYSTDYFIINDGSIIKHIQNATNYLGANLCPS